MRWLKLIVASLAMASVLCTPAFAQGDGAQTPADLQYDDEALSVGDIPKNLADNAADGTNSVNDAMRRFGPPLDAANAATGQSSNSEDEKKVAGLTMLPETGGVPLVGPWAGVLPSAAGVLLLARRAGS